MNKRAMLLAMSLILFPFSLAHSAPIGKMEVAAGKTEGAAELAPQFVDANRFFTGSCRVGPRSGDVTFTCFGLGFPSSNPRLVQCQTRNSPFDPTSYPDQFACQVIGTRLGSVTVRIRRLDDGTGSSGWGQDLRLNLLIVN